MVTEVIDIEYHDDQVGALSFNTVIGVGAFEYTRAFTQTGIELSPLMMPLSDRIYSFQHLAFDTFKGLPGLVADSLPDDFGNTLLNAWIASQGRSPDDITPLQRLQYTGRRGMGALEFVPPKQPAGLNAARNVNIESLVGVAQHVLDARGAFQVELADQGAEDKAAMLALLSVGMSAGGARPKAVLAFNQDFTQVRSGQTKAPEGFIQCLMKFDGVSEHNAGRETFGDPMGYGAMEYVYHLMAKACGIDMMRCRLFDEGGRRHFVTERFDRLGPNKVHIQTLNGLAHVDYKQPGSFSYAELFDVARKLKLTAVEADQLLRRMVFNIVARNHDDHAKNFSFMLKDGRWSLAPAYDLAYSYKPGSPWVNSHWMSLNGKRDNFVRQDLHSLSKISPLLAPDRVDAVIEQTVEVVSRWRQLAIGERVPKGLIDEVAKHLRLQI